MFIAIEETTDTPHNKFPTIVIEDTNPKHDPKKQIRSHLHNPPPRFPNYNQN